MWQDCAHVLETMLCERAHHLRGRATHGCVPAPACANVSGDAAECVAADADESDAAGRSNGQYGANLYIP